MEDRLKQQKINTFVIPIIRDLFIEDCLDSMHKHCDMDIHTVIVIDQTQDGVYDRIKDKIDVYVRPNRNLGFAKAMNTGIRMSTTPYITCANDDIVFIHERWWKGIMGIFGQHENMGGVNPFSLWETGWGYGAKPGDDKRIGEVLDAFGERSQVFNRNGSLFFSYLPEKEEYTNEDYDYLCGVRRGMVDGIATWCTTFRRDVLEKKGLFDERFYPGGGEDYDIGGRFYDPDYPTKGTGKYRLAATSESWVHHLWSQSRFMNKEDAMEGLPIEPERRWNSLGTCWPEKEDSEDRHKDHCFNGHPTLSRGRVGDIISVDF